MVTTPCARFASKNQGGRPAALPTRDAQCVKQQRVSWRERWTEPRSYSEAQGPGRNQILRISEAIARHYTAKCSADEPTASIGRSTLGRPSCRWQHLLACSCARAAIAKACIHRG
eukprot:4923647-Prymnesium_polylepis.2